MTFNKICFCVFTALLTVHFIIAEESSDHDSRKFKWPSSLDFSFGKALNASRNPTHNRHERSLPFLPTISGCNYTTEPGLSCTSCKSMRLCLPNNVGINSNCGVLLPYCSDGLCVSSPSSSCSNSSTSNTQ